MSTSKPSTRLVLVKGLHTLVWAIFAACIVAIPFVAWRGEHGAAALLAVFVFGEVLVLALNGWKCPLTAIAGRYTEARESNFDIYLPLWLAKYNKEIFGTLYVGGIVFTFVHWWLT